MATLILRSTRVLTPNGMRSTSIHIEGGRIKAVSDARGAPGARVEDFGDAVVMPGLVDTHVHVNEPGRTSWEGFETATRAAAAGGVTTSLDMPLNSIPATTSVRALEEKRASAAGKCWVDVGFIAGVVPGNVSELEPLCKAGVRAFKCFLAPSGVDEFTQVTERDLRAALPILTRNGVPLMVHAELPKRLLPCPSTRRYAEYLASRPDAAEADAVALLIKLAKEFKTHIHIVHVSSAESVKLIRQARSRGIAITGETCPHYLTFSADEIPDGATEFKCAPPIRSAATRAALWQGLADGILDSIVSDHSPSEPSLKCRDTGDFAAAWGGIASLQLGLPAVWESARLRGVDIGTVANWMSSAPAKLAGLARRKAKLAEGFEADIVVWHPNATDLVQPSSLYHRHKLTPYLGRTLHGKVLATYVRGVCVYRQGAFAQSPLGQLL